MPYMTALSAVLKGAKIFDVPHFDIDSDLEDEGMDIWDLDNETIESEHEESDSDHATQIPPKATSQIKDNYLFSTQPITEQKSVQITEQNSQVTHILTNNQTYGTKCFQQLLTLLQPYNFYWQDTKISISRGVPQGGKTSPLFFVLLLDIAIRTFEVKYKFKIRKKIKVYADDIAFKFDQEDNIDGIKQKVRDHFKIDGLVINDDKCEDISAQKQFDLFNLSLYKKKFRYLGLNISQHPIKIFEVVISDIHSEQKTSFLNRFKSDDYLYQRIYQQYIFSRVQTKLTPILASAKPNHIVEMINMYKRGAAAFIQRGDSFQKVTQID